MDRFNYDHFPHLSRYVGLCAFIKIVALAIFGIDLWLVTRRKNIDGSPLSAHEVVGSIVSLDKCKFNITRLIIDHFNSIMQFKCLTKKFNRIIKTIL